MVKPRGKNKDEELSLVVLSKGKGVSKKPSAKSTKKNADSLKNVVVVNEKQSRNRLEEQVAVICGLFCMLRVEKEIKTNCKIWSFLELKGHKVGLTKAQIDCIKEVGFGGMLSF
jgi:bifunctional N-acetylglucosamine-1-phosphate-uridyltransferase/glucosamine-1-phosphate-acetyltransferase GlmU-like protein